VRVEDVVGVEGVFDFAEEVDNRLAELLL